MSNMHSWRDREGKVIYRIAKVTQHPFLEPLPSTSNNPSLCRRTSHRSSQRAALHISTAKVKVLCARAIVALTRQTQHTQMPVCAIGRSAGRERAGRLDERAVTRRVPEADLVRGKVDFVRDVVPLVGYELGFPLALAADHPLPGIQS